MPLALSVWNIFCPKLQCKEYFLEKMFAGIEKKLGVEKCSRKLKAKGTSLHTPWTSLKPRFLY